MMEGLRLRVPLRVSDRLWLPCAERLWVPLRVADRSWLPCAARGFARAAALKLVARRFPFTLSLTVWGSVAEVLSGSPI